MNVRFACKKTETVLKSLHEKEDEAESEGLGPSPVLVLMSHRMTAMTMMMTTDALHFVSLHAGCGVTVLTITPGGSPMIIAVLEPELRVEK